MKRRLIAGAVVLACWAPAMLPAQFGGFGFWGGRSVQQNNPPATELILARWRFGTNGMIGHMGWAHNYPQAEMHLNQFIGGATNIDVDLMSFRIVDLGSDEVFQYPFALVSEPGEMDLTAREVENLRAYIARGGFVVVDDFDGFWQFDNFRRQMQLAFPDRPLTPLTIGSRVFHTFFEIESLSIFAPYVPGGDPIFYGLFNEDGTLAMIACYNNDLMNFWDWIGQPRYPLRPSTEAFRMGANFVIYAMTR